MMAAESPDFLLFKTFLLCGKNKFFAITSPLLIITVTEFVEANDIPVWSFNYTFLLFHFIFHIKKAAASLLQFIILTVLNDSENNNLNFNKPAVTQGSPRPIYPFSIRVSYVPKSPNHKMDVFQNVHVCNAANFFDSLKSIHLKRFNKSHR